MLVVWLLASALAGEPADDADDGVVVVEGQRNVAGARNDLDAAVREAGFVRAVRLPGQTVYYAKKRGYGRVVVHDDGLVNVIVPLAAPTHLALVRDVVKPSTNQTPTGSDAFWGDPRKFHVELVGRWSDPRARRGRMDRVLEQIHPWVDAWHDAMSSEAMTGRLAAERDALLGIWRDGVAPDGTALPTPESRRAAIGERWLHTADSAEGKQVRDLVARFVRDVVEVSDMPYTADEIAGLDAKRGFEDVFLR